MVSKIPETFCDLGFNATFCATPTGNMVGIASFTITFAATLVMGVVACRFLFMKPSTPKPLQFRQLTLETKLNTDDPFAWVDNKSKKDLENTYFEGMSLLEYALYKPEPSLFFKLVNKGFRCEFDQAFFKKAQQGYISYLQNKYSEKNPQMSKEQISLMQQAFQLVLEPSEEYNQFQVFVTAFNIQKKFNGQMLDMKRKYDSKLQDER